MVSLNWPTIASSNVLVSHARGLPRDFPSDPGGKNPPASAGHTGSIPGLGIISHV